MTLPLHPPVVLEVAERNRVIYLRVPQALPLGEPSGRLAWKLIDACEDIEQREDQLAGVVLACEAGPFCVVPPLSASDLDVTGPVWAQATEALARLSVPTVACIGGDAVGPAWELALACDLRIAANSAEVGSPEVRWGRIPSAGGTQRLTRSVRPSVALRLLLLGEVVSAATALNLGLLHRVVRTAELEGCLEATLECLRAAAPTALAYAKEAVLSGTDLPLADGLRLEADLATLLQTTGDRVEGIASFRERRSPRFEGR